MIRSSFARLRAASFSFTLVVAAAPVAYAADAAQTDLSEIVVTATLRAAPAETLPGSVTLLSGETLRDAGQQQFEDVLALVPNLNWAGDTQRPRYFQLRGIGELQQYQGAPNPSVGFLIDDIDFSGLGGVATLFDVDHIEVLHGPQGLAYGANALAGLIYVKSADPSSTFGGRVELDAGDYGERSYGFVVSGPVEALDSSYRLAVQRYVSNGFYDNLYLHRNNTDGRDETTVRGKWRYQPSDELKVDLTLMHVALNDGYDAFAIDNTRNTQSDHPSVDDQHSTGASVRAQYSGFKPFTLTAIASYADSLIGYGYDGDWGNPVLWAPYTYNYTEFQDRHRITRSAEFRLANDATTGFAWRVGVYAFDLKEGLTDTSAGVYLDPFDPTQNSQSLTVVSSAYRSASTALYGQIDGDLAPRLRYSLGLRGERHTTRYDDLTTNLDAPSTANHFGPAYDLWGGEASLTYALAERQEIYALLSRGYKAGGFNLSPGLPADQLLFGPEWDLNYEVGHKLRSADGRLAIDTSLFYMQRHAEQLITGEQLDPSNPNTFIFYTGNARSGTNYGLEQSLSWSASERLTLGGSLGLLDTHYHGFVQNGVVLPDRALPNAPNWQAALNATWRDPRGPYARLDLTGMGAFYYDLPPNPTSSKPYELVNAKLGWQGARYETYFWIRNAFNRDYTVRGFYFGDEPPDFPSKVYTQLGEPRNFGVHFTAKF